MLAYIKLLIQGYRDYRAWKWVGTVEGVCVEPITDVKRQSNRSTYWNLYVRGNGERRIETFGTPERDNSQACKAAHARVKAWLNNGPLPELYDRPKQGTPPKQKAKLLVFTGGKGAE